MKRLHVRLWITFAFAVLSISGCSSEEETIFDPPDDPDLAGSYVLVTITQGGITLGPPAAFGTLDLTATNYAVDVTVPDGQGGQMQTIDNGTYSIDGDTWTQESSVAQIQGVGTYEVAGDELIVAINEPLALQNTTRWMKTN